MPELTLSYATPPTSASWRTRAAVVLFLWAIFDILLGIFLVIRSTLAACAAVDVFIICGLFLLLGLFILRAGTNAFKAGLQLLRGGFAQLDGFINAISILEPLAYCGLVISATVYLEEVWEHSDRVIHALIFIPLLFVVPAFMTFTRVALLRARESMVETQQPLTANEQRPLPAPSSPPPNTPSSPATSHS